ncbi:MAG: ABC transporter substrate-binding protein, partial [Chloroflexota bacterium]
ITDDQTGSLTFRLSRPDADFLYALASAPAYPVPPSVLMNSSVDGAFPGTGPYTISAHDDRQVTLTRNPNFVVWDEDARPDGFPDEIDWIVPETPEEAVAMVERGDADYVRLDRKNRPSDDTLMRIRGQEASQIHYAANTVTSVTMNTAVAPFDSVDV